MPMTLLFMISRSCIAGNKKTGATVWCIIEVLTMRIPLFIKNTIINNSIIIKQNRCY